MKTSKKHLIKLNKNECDEKNLNKLTIVVNSVYLIVFNESETQNLYEYLWSKKNSNL